MWQRTLTDGTMRCAFLAIFLCAAAGIAKAQTASEYLQYCEQFERNAMGGGEQLSISDGGPANCWHFFIAFRELADMVDADTRQPNLGLCMVPSCFVLEFDVAQSPAT